MGNDGGVPADGPPAHGFPVSVRVTLPPLGFLLLKKAFVGAAVRRPGPAKAGPYVRSCRTASSVGTPPSAPGRVQLSAAAAVAKRSTRSGSVAAQQRHDERPPEHVAGAGRVDDLHRRGRAPDDTIAVQQQRTLRAHRDAPQPGVRRRQLAQGALGVALAGDGLGQPLRQNRDGQLGEERASARADRIQVAGDLRAGGAAEPGRLDRRGFVHAVHVHDPRALKQRARQRLRGEGQCRVAVRHHHAIAVALVDEDHRRAVGRGAHERVGEVEAARPQRLTQTRPIVVVAEDADVAGTEPHRRAGAQRRHDLSARLVRGAAHLDLRRLGDARQRRQPQHVIDRVLADPDDVPAFVHHVTTARRAAARTTRCRRPSPRSANPPRRSSESARDACTRWPRRA